MVFNYQEMLKRRLKALSVSPSVQLAALTGSSLSDAAHYSSSSLTLCISDQDLKDVKSQRNWIIDAHMLCYFLSQ